MTVKLLSGTSVDISVHVKIFTILLYGLMCLNSFNSLEAADSLETLDDVGILI